MWKKLRNFLISSLFLSPTVACNVAPSTDTPNSDTTTLVKQDVVKRDIVKRDVNVDSLFKDFCFTNERYNDACNGSICWLSSTFETYGAGKGTKKDTPSMAMIGTAVVKGKYKEYRGINQMDIKWTKDFIIYLDNLSQMSDSEFAKKFCLQGKYKNSAFIKKLHQDVQAMTAEFHQGGIGKANWKKTVKAHEQTATLCNEWFLASNYTPGRFEMIQNTINKEGLAVSLKKLHPAILSALHRRVIQSPYTYADYFSQRLIAFVKAKPENINKLNTEAFIEKAFPQYMVDPTKKLFNDSSQVWNEPQFLAALQKVNPQHCDQLTWFEEQRQLGSFEKQEGENKKSAEVLKEKNLNKARIDSPHKKTKQLTEQQIKERLYAAKRGCRPSGKSYDKPKKGKPLNLQAFLKMKRGNSQNS